MDKRKRVEKEASEALVDVESAGSSPIMTRSTTARIDHTFDAWQDTDIALEHEAAELKRQEEKAEEEDDEYLDVNEDNLNHRNEEVFTEVDTKNFEFITLVDRVSARSTTSV